MNPILTKVQFKRPKKYQADLDLDSLHASMHKLGFDGVSLVALDEDGSAMRFKPIAPSGP